MEVEITQFEMKLIQKFRDLKPREKLVIIKNNPNKRIVAYIQCETADVLCQDGKESPIDREG